jgi:hypothetical protein
LRRDGGTGGRGPGERLLTLTIEERTIILAALEDPPDGLVELRGALVREAGGESAKAWSTKRKYGWSSESSCAGTPT